MLRVMFVISLALLSSGLYAQQPAKVEVIADPIVQEMLEKHKVLNQREKVKGWRVQIHFGAEKIKAKEVLSKLATDFPDLKAYELYEQPYFKVRIGDCRTRIEAYKILKQIQANYPAAFLVETDITPEP